MNNIMPVYEWVTTSRNVDWVELPNNTVANQLLKYDDMRTGTGLLLVLDNVMSTSESESHVSNLDMNSYYITKIHGIWYVVLNEEMSDIMKAAFHYIIRELNKKV